MITRLSIALIRLYQYTLSPDRGLLSPWLKGRVCTHEPHCSEYTIQSLRRYGWWRGRMAGLERISRCYPRCTKHYDPPAYRVVFFCSAAIGIPFMDELINDKRTNVVAVVSMPDQPSGRGMYLHPNVITAHTRTHYPDIPVYTPQRIRPDKSQEGRDFYEILKQCDADYFVVIAYGKILPQSILDLPRIAPINVHGSLLPAYRGASPLQSVFLDDLSETGITIMRMTAGCDEGPIIHQVRFPVPFDWTVIHLIDTIKKIGPRHLLATLQQYAQGLLVEIAQDDSKATMCGKYTKEDGLINPFEMSLHDIYGRYRAFAMRPKIYFRSPDQSAKRMIIESLIVDPQKYSEYQHLPLRNPQTYALNPAVIGGVIKPESGKNRDIKTVVFLGGT